MKIKTLVLSLILVSSLLLSFNSFSRWHERGYTSIEQYGSFTDLFHSECNPNVDIFCVNEPEGDGKTKIGYRQDLTASDYYLANCEKYIVAESLTGIRTCEAAQNKNASMAAANTAYNNGDYKKAFDIFILLAGPKYSFKATAESDHILKSSADAAQGDAIAQHKLGQMYYEGKGVPQDYNQAVYWYSKSYKHGYVTAKEYNRILSRGRVKGFIPDNFEY